jgi:NAD(P)-dependent dehydrogenase (short-subunit alcohol dehydrogenase family)
MQLEHKTAVVYGAAGMIGNVVARTFAREVHTSTSSAARTPRSMPWPRRSWGFEHGSEDELSSRRETGPT